MNLIRDLIAIYRHSPATLVLHIAGALIAWFAPEDALTRWPALKSITWVVGEIFPLLPNAVKASQFPDVTALYFALMLAAFPLRLVKAFLLLYPGISKASEFYKKIPLKEKLKGIISPPIFILASIVLLATGYYSELDILPIGRSRLLLGLIGPLFAGGAPIMCIALSASWIWFFICRTFSLKGV